MLLAPWWWRRGASRERFRAKLAEKFVGSVALFASGREGLLALFQSLGLGAGEEVIVQAYTCVVVPNAVRAAGAAPVFADIEHDTLNLALEAVRGAITPRTRAIVCQHTFGIPAHAEALRRICDEHDLVLIEDCAHVLPDETGPAEVGRHGDFLMLSFGRDKAISGVTGGAIVSRRDDVAEKLLRSESRASDLPLARIFVFLLYPLVYWKIRIAYALGFGRVYGAIARMLGFLTPILDEAEKRGAMSPPLRRMPNACAFLALDQLRRLRPINDHRRTLTRFYLDACRQKGWPVLGAVRGDLPLQKFPLFVKEAEKIRRALKRQRIFLDDGWTVCVVCPPGVSVPDAGYRLGEDPEAEAACEEILSLPTHPGTSLPHAKRLLYTLSDAGFPSH